MLAWPSGTWPRLVEKFPALAANTLQTVGARLQETHTRVVEMSTEQVEKRYEWAAARFEGGEVHFEDISLVVTPELAYSVAIERSQVRLAGIEGVVPMALRVTTIYRLEDGHWKMVHRHADPLLTTQGAASVIQR